MSQSQCAVCKAYFDQSLTAGMCPKCLLKGARSDVPTEGHRPPVQQRVPPKPAEIQALFSELEVLDVIGSGGMGFVYKAIQKNLGRTVALKILAHSADDGPDFAERFAREARAMAMLNHPNIVAIYDFGERGPYHFLVMEYVDGLNLRQLSVADKLEPSEALELVPRLCDALQYAHDRGIVHRDIKPENILISQEGHLKVADFGLAKLIDTSSDQVTLTRTQQVMGTLNYMAPEQRERPTEVDHRADIYSLGVVLYELLTGELPLGRFQPPSFKQDVNKRLDNVVMRALEKDPSLRFQQANEFKTGVEQEASASKWMGGSAHEQRMAGKMAQFIFMGLGISIAILGVLSIIMSGVMDSYEWLFLPAGFSGLALGGMITALTGLYIGLEKSPHGSMPQFIFMGLGISIAILGVLCIILSGVLEPSYEWILRPAGFSGLALGGLIAALTGLFFHYFADEKASRDERGIAGSTMRGKHSPEKMPPLVLGIRTVAMAAMYGGIIFFVCGWGWQWGVGFIIGSTFLYSLAGMVGATKGYFHDDERDDW